MTILVCDNCFIEFCCLKTFYKCNEINEIQVPYVISSTETLMMVSDIVYWNFSTVTEIKDTFLNFGHLTAIHVITIVTVVFVCEN
jgi:hypothetical protein